MIPAWEICIQWSEWRRKRRGILVLKRKDWVNIATSTQKCLCTSCLIVSLSTNLNQTLKRLKKFQLTRLLWTHIRDLLKNRLVCFIHGLSCFSFFHTTNLLLLIDNTFRTAHTPLLRSASVFGDLFWLESCLSRPGFEWMSACVGLLNGDNVCVCVCVRAL